MSPRASRSGLGVSLPFAIAGACLGLAFEETHCLAASAPAQLDYRAPKECGTEADVAREFRDLLGDRDEIDPVDARVTVTPRGDGYLLDFQATYRGAKSQRQLGLLDCRGAPEATAVLLLLTVDPLRAAELDEPIVDAPPPATTPSESTVAPPEPAKPSQASASIPPGPKPKARPPQPASPTPRWVALGPLLRSGTSPEVALGGRLEGGVELGASEVVLGLGGNYVLASDLSAVPGGRLDGTLVGIQGTLRLPYRNHVIDVGPCISAMGERLSLAASGVTSPGSGATQWVSLGAGLFARRQLFRPIALELSAGATVPLQRPAYRLMGVGVVHRPSVVGFEAFLGIGWHWNSQS